MPDAESTPADPSDAAEPMMPTKDPISENTERAQWYLRVGENTQYGPVTLPKLVEWARQGRIAPGNQVSRDRRRWIAVDQMPELGMHWMVRDPAGRESGPYNRDAIEALISGGQLPPETTLIDIGAQAGEPDDTDRAAGPATDTQSLHSSTTSPEPNPMDESPATAQTAAAADPATPPAGTDGAVTDAALAAEHKTLRETLKRERARIETQRREQVAERKLAEERLAQLQATIQVLERERDEARQQADQAAEIQGLNRALSEQIETLRAEFEAQQAEWTASLQAAANPEVESAALRELTEALELERQNHAQTLHFANERDVALKAEIEALQQQAAAPETGAAEAQGAGGAAAFPEPLVNLMRNWLAQDRELAGRLREQAATRQDALQTTLRHWSRMPDTQPRGAVDAPSDSDRQLAELRQEHIQATAAAQARERDLLQRVRVLESQEIRLREELRSTENTDENPRALRDRLRQSERNLELANRQHDIDREQWQSAQHALSNRIEEFERAAGTLPGMNGAPADPRPKTPAPVPREHPPVKSRGGFQPTPWMRLK